MHWWKLQLDTSMRSAIWYCGFIYDMCRFLQPEAVFHNFEQKMVSICQKDFTNFNEFLALMAAKDVQTEPSDKGNTFFVMGNPNSTLTYSD